MDSVLNMNTVIINIGGVPQGLIMGPFLFETIRLSGKCMLDFTSIFPSNLSASQKIPRKLKDGDDLIPDVLQFTTTIHVPLAYSAEHNLPNDPLKMLTKLQIILQPTLQMLPLSYIKAFKALHA